MEVAMRKKILDSRNQFEDLIQMAKNSEQGMDFLFSSLSNLVEPLQKITPATRVNKQVEFKSSWYTSTKWYQIEREMQKN